ncbi:MAG: GNAT family N-acetyltransferase [Nitrosopumilaceae archaeon]
MHGIEIRNATKQDIPIILGLLYELERPKPNNEEEKKIFEKKIQQYISDSDKQILVALVNLEIIGLASIIFLSRLNRTQHELYIPELIVRNEFRSRGIGKKLITTCIEIGKKKKCHRIRLESGNARTDTHKFYSNLGFMQSAFSFTKILN